MYGLGQRDAIPPGTIRWQRPAAKKRSREKIMPNSWKGVIAGFVATVILSVIFVLFKTFGILPELDIVQHIDKLGSIQMAAAWVDHFIVGTLLWGPIFTGFDAT